MTTFEDDDYDADVVDDWEQLADEPEVAGKAADADESKAVVVDAAKKDVTLNDDTMAAAAEMTQKAHEAAEAVTLFGQSSTKLFEEKITSKEEAEKYVHRLMEHLRSFSNDKNYEAAVRVALRSVVEALPTASLQKYHDLAVSSVPVKAAVTTSTRTAKADLDLFGAAVIDNSAAAATGGARYNVNASTVEM